MLAGGVFVRHSGHTDQDIRMVVQPVAYNAGAAVLGDVGRKRLNRWHGIHQGGSRAHTYVCVLFVLTAAFFASWANACIL